jgi:hypothetical protein
MHGEIPANDDSRSHRNRDIYLAVNVEWSSGRVIGAKRIMMRPVSDRIGGSHWVSSSVKSESEE